MTGALLHLLSPVCKILAVMLDYKRYMTNVSNTTASLV